MASTLSTTEATRLAPVGARPPGRGKKRPGPTRTGSIFPPALIYTIFFIVPTFASFYFSFTRWDLFTSTWIGLKNYKTFFAEQALIIGLRNTLIYAVITSGLKVVLGMALALLLTSKIIARGYLRSVIFFPVLVSTIGVGLTFTVLMNPERGLINQALAVVGIDGPGWLTNPSLALFSIALVDVWKGVGLATVIYIAGLVSIPSEYYEAAEVDGASRWNIFRNIILPLARPATATVITLSLIGGLRSFDLIWAMTKGGPGFRLRRHRVGDLQAVPGRVLRTVHRGQRGAVPGRHDHRGPADLVAQPRGGVLMKNTRGVVIGVAAILVTAIFFVVPFLFIFVIASKDRTEANLLEFSWPTNFVLFDNLPEALAARDYLMVIAFINSFILTVASVAALVILSAMVAYIWQRRRGRLEPGDQHLGAGRTDRAARHRAHDLGAAERRAVQNHARSDPHRDRLRTPVLHPAVPRLHRGASPGSWTRPPWSTEPDLCRSSSGSSSRCSGR